jgi:hypothetical protein
MGRANNTMLLYISQEWHFRNAVTELSLAVADIHRYQPMDQDGIIKENCLENLMQRLLNDKMLAFA